MQGGGDVVGEEGGGIAIGPVSGIIKATIVGPDCNSTGFFAYDSVDACRREKENGVGECHIRAVVESQGGYEQDGVVELVVVAGI